MSKPEAYKSTPVFDENTLPQALQKAHSTKAGIWGLLELLSGDLVYVIEENGNSRHMKAGNKQIIEPQKLHHVELVGPVQMQVHFFREKPG